MSSSVQVIFEHDEDLSSDDSSDAEYMYDNFEDHEIDSDDEEKEAKHTEDGQEISRCTNEITVYVTVDDDHPDGPMPPIHVHCGNGENTFKWLSVVAMSRYSALSKSSGRLRSREHFHVKRGSYMPLVVEGNTAKWPPSRYIAPEMKISSVLQHEDPVTIKLNANGTPDILIDGRLQTRTSMLDTHTMYVGDAFLSSELARQCHMEHKKQMQREKKQKQDNFLSRAKFEFFGLKDGDKTETDTKHLARQHFLVSNNCNFPKMLLL